MSNLGRPVSGSKRGNIPDPWNGDKRNREHDQSTAEHRPLAFGPEQDLGLGPSRLTLASTEGRHYIGPVMDLATSADFDLLKCALDYVDSMPADVKSRLAEHVQSDRLDGDFRYLVLGLEKLRHDVMPGKEELWSIAYPGDIVADVAGGFKGLEGRRNAELAHLLDDCAERLHYLGLHEKFMWALDIAEKYYPDPPAGLRRR